ncbi:MAG: MarC family protein [bacterium]|nr:MarC family protein [bacterium]
MHHINYVQIIFSFIIMINPIILTSFFLSITKEYSNKERYLIATTCFIASLIIIIGFIFLGDYILKLFSINIDDLYIAGGLLFLIVGMSMVLGKGNESHFPKKDSLNIGQEREDCKTLGVVPLAVPMASGPGTIVFAIVYARQCETLESRTLLIVIVIAVMLVAWICMIFATRLGKLMGKAGQAVLSRLMGLLLVAIASNMIIHGIKQAFHLLGK